MYVKTKDNLRIKKIQIHNTGNYKYLGSIILKDARVEKKLKTIKLKKSKPRVLQRIVRSGNLKKSKRTYH